MKHEEFWEFVYDVLIIPVTTLLTMLFILLFTAGCPPTPPPVPPRTASCGCDLGSQPPRACTTNVRYGFDDVCPGWFTADGHQCVQCIGDAQCIDTAAQIYCANPACSFDSACKKR